MNNPELVILDREVLTARLIEEINKRPVRVNKDFIYDFITRKLQGVESAKKQNKRLKQRIEQRNAITLPCFMGWVADFIEENAT
jgi:hypothetical protein